VFSANAPARAQLRYLARSPHPGNRCIVGADETVTPIVRGFKISAMLVLLRLLAPDVAQVGAHRLSGVGSDLELKPNPLLR